MLLVGTGHLDLDTDAAVVMGEVRSALRAYALIDPSPASVLARLDTLVSRHSVIEQPVTVVYGLIDADRTRITLALAGHPPPLVTRGDEVTLMEEGTGSALGVGAGPWPETEVPLTADTTLLLYSDGLVEHRDRELGAGLAALVDEVRRVPRRRRHPRDLCARLADALTGPLTDDDVTLLAVAVGSATSGLTGSTPLPADHQAPGVARRFIRTTLTGWAVTEDTIDTAELCVSELVTNAVIHTGTAAELTVRLDDDVLTVEVRDSGGEGTVRAESFDDPLTISGRGLSLVEALTTAWSAERSADGTTVWFELENAAERLLPDEPAPQVRLERLSHRRPCRRPRAGRPRPGRRAGARRRTPWRCAVRTTASVVTSILAPSAVPYQTSTKPVLWVSSHSSVPSALGRRKPVSIAASRTFSPCSSTIQARLM